MAKEIIAVTPADMGDIEITSAALDAYRLARSLPVEMDEETEADIISRRNLYSVAFRDLTEFRKRIEKLAKDIKECTEHIYNIGGPDQLPPEGEDGVKISWSKQSYTPKWSAEGAGVESSARSPRRACSPWTRHSARSPWTPSCVLPESTRTSSFRCSPTQSSRNRKSAR